jgi:hypothetical protein
LRLDFFSPLHLLDEAECLQLRRARRSHPRAGLTVVQPLLVLRLYVDPGAERRVFGPTLWYIAVAVPPLIGRELGELGLPARVASVCSTFAVLLADRRGRLLASMSAPAISNIRMVSAWRQPPIAAHISAVLPLSLASILAPASRSVAIVSKSPSADATINAFLPVGVQSVCL